VAPPPALATKYLYTGQQFDAETGQYSLRARYYQPTIGRFTGRDAWAINYSDPLELNRYVYTANNPLDYEDPSGYSIDFGALIKKVGAATSTAVLRFGKFLDANYTRAMIYLLKRIPWLSRISPYLPALGCGVVQATTEADLACVPGPSNISNAVDQTNQAASDLIRKVNPGEGLYDAALAMRDYLMRTLTGKAGAEIAEGRRNLALGTLIIDDRITTWVASSGDPNTNPVRRIYEGLRSLFYSPASEIVVESATDAFLATDVGHPRNHDSEFKIMTAMYDYLTEAVRGRNADEVGSIVIDIYTEREPCPSCERVAGEFAERLSNLSSDVNFGLTFGSYDGAPMPPPIIE
jgi:RHS repeat-associated protein